MRIEHKMTPVEDAETSGPGGATPGDAIEVGGPALSVVVPTFNEVENVAEVVRRLDACLAGIAWEVIFVDDDSPDGTADKARELAASDRRVRIIHRLRRRGLSGASIEGIMSSSASVVAVMDGDLQHDETLLPQMLDRIRDGADLVVGSRYLEGGSSGDGLTHVRQSGSHVATWMSRRITRTRLSDPMSGFFMVRREVFAKAAPTLATDGFKILLDLASNLDARARINELPFEFRSRHAGESKMDSAVAADFLGLLISKLFGNAVSVRFFLFMMVGLSGVAVHLAALRGFLVLADPPFELAQLFATVVAMTTNFFLNNWFTFRDKRLRGWCMVVGLFSFYAVCSIGLIANVGVATWIHSHDAIWWVAGTAGALTGAVFNYAASSAITWRT